MLQRECNQFECNQGHDSKLATVSGDERSICTSFDYGPRVYELV